LGYIRVPGVFVTACEGLGRCYYTCLNERDGIFV
jgi:hypothetical protein